VLNLGGKPVTIPENPIHALFINTAGIDLVLIGVIVLVVSKNPLKNRKIILFNGLGRILFAFVILYYVLVADVIRIIMVFGVIDVFISIGFLIYLYKLKDFGSEDSPKTKIS
jgi:ABC-type Fe3+-siderophore transport system permease subunit